jgi:hypothetical protein
MTMAEVRPKSLPQNAANEMELDGEKGVIFKWLERA